MEIVAKTGSEAYVELIRALLRDGEPTSPRGHQTHEILNATIRIEDALTAHVYRTARRFNDPILATEAMQLLGGVSSLEQLDLASAGNFTQFSNEGRLRGAYGPRTRRQLPQVVDLLRRDPDSRQAVLTVWNGRELDQPCRDVPCTTSVQFLLRDDQLHTRFVMRSSDAILGIPYDWWFVSRLGVAVASALDVEVGSFTHTTGSLHFYDRDLGEVNDIDHVGVTQRPKRAVPPSLVYQGDLTDPVDRIRALSQVARDVCLHSDEDNWDGDYPGVTWYLDTVPRLDDAVECEWCHYIVPRSKMASSSVCVECD